MSPEEKLKQLIEDVERVASYVLATLPYPAGFVARSSVGTTNPEWTAIHKGRGQSSARMLEQLLQRAKEMK